MRKCERRRKGLGLEAVQMESLRGLLGIRRTDKVLNASIRQLCRVMKEVVERIEGVLWWLDHVERMENDRLPRGFM